MQTFVIYTEREETLVYPLRLTECTEVTSSPELKTRENWIQQSMETALRKKHLKLLPASD